MPEIPGITISILRSQTFGATGQPLQISGRVTVFGVPLPLTFVRVSLTGPDYDPQTLAFDTLADPEGATPWELWHPVTGIIPLKRMRTSSHYSPGSTHRSTHTLACDR